MLLDEPTFDAASGLARYIHPDYRGRRNQRRPQPGAFQAREDESYLSVNSTEVETLGQIAGTYAVKFEKGRRPVAIATPKVEQYNEAASGVGLRITYNENAEAWEFGDAMKAYKHWWKEGNKSHCGVEYVQSFGDQQGFNFAVRMIGAANYREY